MVKIGFILGPKSRLSGALECNRDLFYALNKKGLNAQALIPKTDKFYNISGIGSVLTYFTLYPYADKLDYVIGTSFATLPFIKSNTKSIQILRGSAIGMVNRVMDNFSQQNKKERAITNKWHKYFLKNKLSEDEIINKLKNILLSTSEAERVSLNHAEKIIVVSPIVEEEIIKYYKIKKKKIKVIYNAVADFWFEKNKTISDEPELFFASKAKNSSYIFLEKGLDRVFEIFEKVDLKKRMFLHFGSSDDFFRRSFSQKTKKLGINLYENLGRKELKDSYHNMGIYVQTSRTEAFGLSLVEAMASGMVPVSYPVGIATNIIKNGVNGYLVSSTKEAIEVIKLLARNRAKQVEMSSLAKQTVSKRFNFSSIVSNYNRTIKAIINKK